MFSNLVTKQCVFHDMNRNLYECFCKPLSEHVMMPRDYGSTGKMNSHVTNNGI